MARKSERDLENHLRKVEKCGTNFSAIGHNFPDGPIFSAAVWRCGSRFCPHCAKQRRSEILQKLQYFSKLKHTVKLELTFPDTSPDPNRNPDFYSKAWDIFLKRIRRRFPKFKYFRIVELTKRGIPHFHIIINQYISQKWISKTFPECGGGKITWIRKVDAGRAFVYVTKYISKVAADADDNVARFFFLSGMRQYSSSRNIYIRAPRKKNFYWISDEGKSFLFISRKLEIISLGRKYIEEWGPAENSHVWHEPHLTKFIAENFSGTTAREIQSELYMMRFEHIESHILPILYF
jgi:hypothetical protein